MLVSWMSWTMKEKTWWLTLTLYLSEWLSRCYGCTYSIGLNRGLSTEIIRIVRMQIFAVKITVAKKEHHKKSMKKFISQRRTDTFSWWKLMSVTDLLQGRWSTYKHVQRAVGIPPHLSEQTQHLVFDCLYTKSPVIWPLLFSGIWEGYCFVQVAKCLRLMEHLPDQVHRQICEFVVWFCLSFYLIFVLYSFSQILPAG